MERKIKMKKGTFGSISIPLTNGSRSGSRRPKNMWIRWIQIRLRIRIRTLKGTVEEERGHKMRKSCLNCTVPVPVNSRGHLGLNKKDFVVVVSRVVVVYPYLILFFVF